MRYANLTEHPIRVLSNDGEIEEFAPHGVVARLLYEDAGYPHKIDDRFVFVRKWFTTLDPTTVKLLRSLSHDDEPTVVIVSGATGRHIENNKLVWRNVVVVSPDTDTGFFDISGRYAVRRLTIHSDGRDIDDLG